MKRVNVRTCPTISSVVAEAEQHGEERCVSDFLSLLVDGDGRLVGVVVRGCDLFLEAALHMSGVTADGLPMSTLVDAALVATVGRANGCALPNVYDGFDRARSFCGGSSAVLARSELEMLVRVFHARRAISGDLADHVDP